LPPDSNPKKDRHYLVLEELDVGDLMLRLLAHDPGLVESVRNVLDEADVAAADRRVYVMLGPIDARNAKGARRQAANRHYGDGDDRLPERLVSVPTHNWQPGPVNRSSQLRVG
jgi:hypothetical protein